MADGPERLFYDALPRLEVDGREDTLANALLQQLEMSEAEGGLASLELRFTNTGEVAGRGHEMPFESGAHEGLGLGARLRLVAGDTHDPQELFRGIVTGLELVAQGSHPPQLVVLAEDALQTARLRRRSRVFADVTLDDLVARIAQDHGLRVVSAGLDQAVGTEVQLNETDLGFLRRMCARFDVDLQIVGDELHVAPCHAVDRGALSLDFGDRLVAVRALADLADQVSAVTLSGWDPAAARSFEVESSATALGPGAGRTGAMVLAAVLDPRREHGGPVSVASRAEAQAIVDATHRRRARRFVTVEGTATGDPRLRVGSEVVIGGIGPRFANTYYVTHTQHRFDRTSGYLTEFRAACAFFGG
ncbi:MAG: phage late control D family protein [Geminicoccaceae bacterium]|nr:MAG: phage late control D family protein [Geminicoccaceae bacterium]